MWRLSSTKFGELVARVPAPLAIGSVVLADRSAAKEFLCERWAVHDAEDTTDHRGWRACRRASGA